MTTVCIEIELYHLTLLDIFKVSTRPRKRETSGPNPCLSSDSVPPVHLQQDSKQRTGKWNAWAERQRTMWCTWIEWNELALTKPGRWERVPSKLWGLICLTEWETPQSRKKLDPWLVLVKKKKDTCFPFFSSHYHYIRTAVWINSLIGSVKQTETSHIGTIELNSMSCHLRCSNQRTRSAFKVSVIMQVAKTIGKCQTKTIQSTSHISIQPLGLFCNKPEVVIGRANYEGSSYTTG